MRMPAARGVARASRFHLIFDVLGAPLETSFGCLRAGAAPEPVGNPWFR
jgi:hypothetical protein